MLSFQLQSMQDALAKQGESCPAIAHTLDQLQLVDFTLDDPIAFGPRQARLHCRFLAFNAQHETEEGADLAAPDLLSPGIELLASPRAQHLDKLLDQVIGRIDLWMKLSEQSKCVLFLCVQILGPTKKEKGGRK